MGVMKTCRAKGCLTLIPHGQARCARHAASFTQQRSADIRDAGYRSPHWQQIRSVVLDRAAGQCELRLPGCHHGATHVRIAPELDGNRQAATAATSRAACSKCDPPAGRPDTA